ncbi:putative acyltransferase [Lachnellula suecica]|uniref:Putative acyltransferase n=1 Tax=Lachnellula suecica TaxID=602035 RepID=A0A8T9BY08_9HELO|nr:putative acyltransferase [Lachnellula suecica]
MADSNIRHRKKSEDAPDTSTGTPEEHPGGDIKHGGATQVVRFFLLITWFLGGCCTIVTTQLIGAPLYWINRNLYYAYMALTKQSFGIIVTTITQWWSPTLMRVSGDASVAGRLRKTADGRIEVDFPERMIMIANHQLYTEWQFLWWVAYTNRPQMHGHIYIMLKESLKRLPIAGIGMMFYGFIFMSRKMDKDKPRIAHRLNQLKGEHSGPLSGSSGLDPMWLLIFPEGTNLSANTKKRSAAWAEKQGLANLEHTLLPRSTGLYFVLQELQGTVDYIYDTTMAYEGIPRGKYGEDYYSLRSMTLKGQVPPSVNMYWRRFAVNKIPLASQEVFDVWLRERWIEKDALMEQYISTGRFPGSKKATVEGAPAGEKEEFIEAYVKLAHWYEILNIFVVLAISGMIAHLAARAWNLAWYGKQY